MSAEKTYILITCSSKKLTFKGHFQQKKKKHFLTPQKMLSCTISGCQLWKRFSVIMALSNENE